MTWRPRALIVDDEVPARRYLRTLLAELGNPVEIVGEAGDGPAAVRATRRLAPDLLFLDVQMPGGDGFGVLHALRDDDLPYVVFVTAHDQYAVQAFEVQALDYLLKPVGEEPLRRAIDRAIDALRRGREAALAERLERLLASLERTRESTPGARLPVRSGGRVRLVAMDRIDWIEAADKHVTLHLGGSAVTMRASLSDLERRLDPLRFLRVHRRRIVNVDRIVELQPWFHGDFVIILTDGTRFPTGRAYREQVRRLAGGALRDDGIR